MEYYRCPTPDLHRELERRGYRPSGSPDELAEKLQQDDEHRSTAATTIATNPASPKSLPKWRPLPESGMTTPITLLVNECIVHWTLNTFSPSLHLFFSSGLSVLIEGNHLPSALIGLDPALRSRLTDLPHEESGHLTNGIFPRKFLPNPSLRILEATIAARRSIAVKQTPRLEASRPVTSIVEETHVVVGLRLQGMPRVGYVWARRPVALVEGESETRMWGHVRVAGLRDDVPVPFVGFPHADDKPGARIAVVQRGSLVSPKFRSE